MTDVFSILMDDHRRVERLFSQYESGSDPAVALQICDALTVHALVEEEAVYPVMAAKAGAQGQVMEARHEHDEAKLLCAQIDTGAMNGEDVADLVRQLKEAVQHHVEEEENELFPKLKKQVPKLVEKMGDDVLARKQALDEEMRDARSLNMPSRVVPARPPTG